MTFGHDQLSMCINSGTQFFEDIVKFISKYNFEKNEQPIVDFESIDDIDDMMNKLNSIKNIGQIIFPYGVNCPINLKSDNFTKLKIINFSKLFNSDFELPDCVEEINFGDDFNKKIFNLPSGVKIIRFGKSFNSEFKLPNSVELIYFGENFNLPIDGLPENLINLEFNPLSHFNQPINNLPGKLNKIIMCNNFTQCLNNLPESLEFFEFYEGSKYNNSLDNFPNNLKKLTIGRNFTNSIDNLPDSINELTIYSTDIIMNKLPSSLKKLNITIRLFRKICSLNNYINELDIIYEYYSHTLEELNFLLLDIENLSYGKITIRNLSLDISSSPVVVNNKFKVKFIGIESTDKVFEIIKI